jgi:hypothetical protein
LARFHVDEFGHLADHHPLMVDFVGRQEAVVLAQAQDHCALIVANHHEVMVQPRG